MSSINLYENLCRDGTIDVHEETLGIYLICCIYIYQTMIETTANFAHSRLRGFRAPNQYSAKSLDELKLLSTTERIHVHNARLLDPPATIDSHGFELVTVPTDVDMFDTHLVRNVLYPECRELLMRVRRCYDVRGGMHEYRNGFANQTGPRRVQPTPNGSGGAYAMGIHADMCAAIERTSNRYAHHERHFENINIWRSTRPNETVQMMPLAVCDMRSVNPDDIVFGDGMNTSDTQQYTKVVDQRLIYSPKQMWYYFPYMTPDEVLLFRQYDTRQEELNLRTVFHQAVVDPTSAEDAPSRYSIEIRMGAVYGLETNKAQRVERFMAQISDRYPDGHECNWWSGPIENYVPRVQLES